MKTCKDCGEEKPIADFHRQRATSDGLHSYCKPCLRIRVRGYHLTKKYGLTVSAYEALLDQQAGGCAICHTSSAGKHEWPLYVDHDHETGLIRGLLCQACNSILGYAHDDIETLASAISYLSRSAQ